MEQSADRPKLERIGNVLSWVLKQRFDDEGRYVQIDASQLRLVCETERLPSEYFESLLDSRTGVERQRVATPSTATRYAFQELQSMSAFSSLAYSPSGPTLRVWRRWIDITKSTHSLLRKQYFAMVEDLITSDLSEVAVTPVCLLGIDVGFAKKKATTGVATSIGQAISRSKTKSGWQNIRAAIPKDFMPSIVVMDGPLVPKGKMPESGRAVDSLFQRGQFQRRCKPGAAHVGSGLLLFEATLELANSCESICSSRAEESNCWPRVLPDSPIAETFPNLVLGVLTSDAEFNEMPSMRRGKKFDWLFERNRGRLAKLSECTRPASGELAEHFENVMDHDEKAALVCLLIATFIARGDVAWTGNSKGGWYFLPPWKFWENWAIEEYRKQKERMEVEGVAIEDNL